MRLLGWAMVAMVAAWTGCGFLGSEEPPVQSDKDRLAELPASEPVPDPASDEVLQVIVSTVNDLTDDQLEQIYALYVEFRSEQAKLTRHRPRTRGDANGGARGGDGRPDRAKAGKAGRDMRSRDGARDGARERAPEAARPHGEPRRGGRGGGTSDPRLDKLAADFLAAGRALMRPDQLEAWDACASSIDLSPYDKNTGRAGAPAAGSVAPDFTLPTLQGDPVTLSSLRGKPTIVEFGSYTCPIFRGNVPEVQPLVSKYAGKANFVLVYGREAHTTDGDQVQGNIRDGIIYDQPKTLAEREAIARTAISALDLKSTVVIDGMDDLVTDSWAGHPNGGFILDSSGTVVSTMGYVDAVEIDRYLGGL